MQPNTQIEFEMLVNVHNKKLHNKPTSCKDVLQFLYDNKEKKIWWWSWEFIGKRIKDAYLSHRAPARASQLCHFIMQ